MRFSTVSMMALPLLAAASHSESPIDQAKAQAQYWFDKVSSYIPKASTQHPVQAATAKLGTSQVHILTLENWRSTILNSITPTTSSSNPQEWWILATGGNKTCFGLCQNLDTGFNASAGIFALDPTAPHMAVLNCDNEPVLCNSWGAGPPHLWTMELTAPDAPVTVRTVPLNHTTTDVSTFTEFHSTKSYKNKTPYEGWFHPFDGELAKLGLAVPVGYILWFFATVPSWAFMIGVSFISRTIMNRRQPTPRRAPAAARPRGAAPAGDGVTY
ncbi:hypothetical protein ACMFMG_004340 [Clarireedia jacksonii]